MTIEVGAYPSSGGIFVGSSKTVDASLTLPNTSNWMSIGPITISSGVTVTIASGATWVVV